MKNELRIAFTGGGTGGHIYPLLAVADEVKHTLAMHATARPYKLIYFGNTGRYSQEFMTRSIRVVRIGASKLRRYMSFLNIVDALKFPFVLLQALFKMFFVMPDVLFSKGGTGAFPVVFAAWVFRIPIIIHESDSVPGLTNVLSAKLSSRIAVSFESAAEYFPPKKTAVVGNPFRTDLLDEGGETIDKIAAKRILGFNPELPVLLILGGSQGSRRINDFILDNARALVRKYQLLHQTGQEEFELFKHEVTLALSECIDEEKRRYKIVPFLKRDIKDAYLAADIVVARAGSGTIFETAHFGKPAILIPLRESAKDHQRLNAYAYARHGAAAVIEEDNLEWNLFSNQIERILGDEKVYEKMVTSAQSFQTSRAAVILADEIIRLASE